MWFFKANIRFWHQIETVCIRQRGNLVDEHEIMQKKQTTCNHKQQPPATMQRLFQSTEINYKIIVCI